MGSRFRGPMLPTFSCKRLRSELTSEQLLESAIERAPNRLALGAFGRHTMATARFGEDRLIPFGQDFSKAARQTFGGQSPLPISVGIRGVD
jgi:hypothetical protein